MSEQHERYYDRIGTNDEVKFDLPRRSLFKTDITLTDFDGNTIISLKKHRANMTVLAGRLTTLEKAFGILPDATQRLLISDQIPVPTVNTSGDAPVTSMDDDPAYASLHSSNTIFGDAAVSAGRTFKDKVNYFCIGNGGENPNTPYAILDIHDWETRLYNMVPFRCVPVSNDLSVAERKLYRLRKMIEIDGSQYYAYYAKVFDPGTIFSMKSDAEYTPKTEDSNPYIGNADGHPMKGHTSEVYITFDLEIAANEFKEFYRAIHSNTLTGARLTELGLIAGYEGPSGDVGGSGVTELYDPTLFAKLVHEPVFLSTEGSRRKVTYSIFT
ncbi:MAG: DUF7208 family protein [Anaeroplasmataceae bacterium]